jgi:hypothetical protein
MVSSLILAEMPGDFTLARSIESPTPYGRRQPRVSCLEIPIDRANAGGILIPARAIDERNYGT